VKKTNVKRYILSLSVKRPAQNRSSLCERIPPAILFQTRSQPSIATSKSMTCGQCYGENVADADNKAKEEVYHIICRFIKLRQLQMQLQLLKLGKVLTIT